MSTVQPSVPQAKLIPHPTQSWGIVIIPPQTASATPLQPHEVLLLALQERIHELQDELNAKKSPALACLQSNL